MSQNKKRSSGRARPRTPGETIGVREALEYLTRDVERPIKCDPDYLNSIGPVAANPSQLPTRLLVYLLASVGYCQQQIAEILGEKPATVSYHIDDQVTRRFLTPQVSQPGYREIRTNPKFYQKGRKGPVIEPLLSGLLPVGRNQVYDGGNEFDHPLYCRVHCTNGYTFELSEWRDFNEYKMKVGRDVLKLPLFPREPYKKTSDVYCFLTYLYYDGEWVPIDAQFSSTRSILRVWPPSAYQTLQEMEACIGPFDSMLKSILYPLHRYADWKLGTGVLSGELHYAFRFPDAERLLPNSFRIPNELDDGQIWADHSLGQEELETNSRQFAIEWLRAQWSNYGVLSKPLEKENGRQGGDDLE